MQCVKCGMRLRTESTVKKVIVLNGRKIPAVKRYRICDACMERITTVEMPESDSVAWLPVVGESGVQHFLRF